ncbi:MAG TPA: hydrogenase maturation nickel metallochaperone HypA [Steroidobacteraceae bacterium]
MHELSITRSVVAIVSEQAVGQRVTRVRLEIGSLSAILPDAIRFCFDICAADTPLAGAELQIVEIPGLGCCNECGAEVPLETLVGRCPRCGTSSLRLIAGQELNIKEIEVQSCA